MDEHPKATEPERQGPRIHYLVGDATEPIGDGKKYVLHVVNDEGKWGAGFVLALSKKWSWPETCYRNHASAGRLKLGTVQFVPVVEDKLWVVNMVAQRGVRSRTNQIPLSYGALEACLRCVGSEVALQSASIHAPRFGAGLAGGSWLKIEALLQRTLPAVDVYIYDLRKNYETP